MNYVAFGALFACGVPSEKKDLSDMHLLKEKIKILAENSTCQNRLLRTFDSSKSIYEIAEAMATGIKRVLVSQMWANFDRLVTQTDVVQFLHNHKKNLGSVVDKTLDERGLVEKYPVLCINRNQTALEGFYQIFTHNVNAVAIVDSDGTLFGNLSASDLRGMTADRIGTIYEPVDRYLQLRPGRTIHPIVVTRDVTVGHVMDLVVKRKVHRVWIVNEVSVPIGVVTLTDIILCFIS